jgi:AI-2E family transporter
VARVERNPSSVRSPAAGPAELHLWQIAAARDIIIILGVAFTVWVVYRLSDIFLPVLLALILAHIINPFVTLMERRWGWARPLTISFILTAITLSLIGLFAWLGPILYEQSTMLANRLPDYLRTLTAAYGVESGTVIDQLDETIRRFQIDPKQVVGQLFRTTGRAVGILTFVFSATTYWLLSIALVAIYVFFFSWHFNSGVEKLSAYVPASRRPRVRAIVARMDGAIRRLFQGTALDRYRHGRPAFRGLVFRRRSLLVFSRNAYGFVKHRSLSFGHKLADRHSAQVCRYPYECIRRDPRPACRRPMAQRCLRRGAVFGGLVFDAMDPERPDQHERGDDYLGGHYWRRCGGRAGNAARDPGRRLHQDIFRRGRAAAPGEVGRDPLKKPGEAIAIRAG